MENEIKKSDNTTIQQQEIITPKTELVEDKNSKRMFHPLSGGLMMLIDNAFWGVELATFETGVLATMFLSFIITFVGTYMIQKNIEKDNSSSSMTKAFILAVLAGVPWSIAGSSVGLFILGLAGIKSLTGKK